MKPIPIRGARFLKWFKIEGIVLYPFVLFLHKHPHEELSNHERIHCDQILRDGFFSFYSRYLWEYFCNRRKGMNKDQAYRSISYEKEAYQNHHDSSYIITQRRS